MLDKYADVGDEGGGSCGDSESEEEQLAVINDERLREAEKEDQGYILY